VVIVVCCLGMSRDGGVGSWKHGVVWCSVVFTTRAVDDSPVAGCLVAEL
jgi:hypothetical protein